MHRTQVKLTDKQIKAVRALANSKGMSMDEIIRMSVDDYIESEWNKKRVEQKKKAFSVAGKYRSGLSDLAQNHDKYLAEDLEK